MDENKTEQYTFGPDEKEILEILGSFEKEFGEKQQENTHEIQSVRYYENFVIRGMKDCEISGVFFSQEKDDDGNISYHLYYQSPENEILSIDSEGNIQIDPKWEEVIGEIDFGSSMEINDREKGRLRGISEKAEPEEIERALNNPEEKNENEGKENEEKENDEQQEDETEEVENDLREQGEDLKITKFKKIKDNHISEKMPEVFKDSEENGIAYSNKLNRFVIISKINGQYQLNENIEPGKTAWRSIISIDSDGEKVERRVPHSLMRLPNNPDKEIAITVDQYGYPDIETVNVLPCQERVARAVRIEGEGQGDEENLQTREYFEKSGKETTHDFAHQVKDIEEVQEENGVIDNDITEEDYIPNTQITWGQLEEETGESLPKLIERYNKEINERGKTSQEAVEEIEYDYGNIEHEHKR